MASDEPPTSTAARPVVGMYSFLSPDPQRLARFWADLMQLPTAEGASDDLVMLDFDHEVSPTTWIFERVSEVGGSTAPIGLDVGVNDESEWVSVAERAEALGATRVTNREQSGVRWVEMRDPDGNRFRVFAPRPE